MKHGLDNAEVWFWPKVEVRRPSECWPWTSRTENGYGRVWSEGKQWRAHQLAYRLAHGDPKGIVCHKCANRLCCNPAHLYDGTPLSNTQDRRAMGVSTSRAGALNHQAKLTMKQARAIRASSRPSSELAAKYGVSFRTVWLIRTGKSYVEHDSEGG